MTCYITDIKHKECLVHASIHVLLINNNDNLNLHIAFLWLTTYDATTNTKDIYTTPY